MQQGGARTKKRRASLNSFRTGMRQQLAVSTLALHEFSNTKEPVKVFRSDLLPQRHKPSSGV